MTMEKMKSRGEQIDQVSISAPKVSGFDISSDNNGTCKLGYIVPTRCRPLLPGDTIKGSERTVLNFEPLAVDLMSNMYYKSERFIVPWRLVWHNFSKWYGGKETANNTAYTPPRLLLSDVVAYFVSRDLLPSVLVPSKSHKFAYLLYISDSHEIRGNVDLFYQFANLYDVYFDQLKSLVLSFNSDLGTNIDIKVEQRYNVNQIGEFYDRLFQDILSSNLSTLQKLDLMGDAFCMPFNMMFDCLDLLIGQSSLFDYLNAPCISASEFKKSFRDTYLSGILNAGYRAYGDSFPEMFKNRVLNLDPDNPYNIHLPSHESINIWPEILTSNLDLTFRGVSVKTGLWALVLPQYLSTAEPSDTYVVFPNPGFGSAYGKYIPEKSFLWLPFRANYMVWYYNYRDKVLETDHIDPEDYTGDSIAPEEILEMSLLRPRAWSKDTFTTALTNTGSGNVYVPTDSTSQDLSAYDVEQSGGNDITQTVALNGVLYRLPSKYLEANTPLNFDTQSQNSGISVDNISRARRLARFLQKELILSTDYADVLFSHWAVKLSDKSLHRPEWIDGQSEMITINPVLNNTTTAEQDAGTKTGLAFMSSKSDGFEKFIEELSFEFSYMSVMPYQSYPFGLPRFWNIINRFDVPWAEFADLGMDAIYNEEILQAQGVGIGSGYLSQDRPTFDNQLKLPQQIFGYQGRYYDYKTSWSEVHGRLKTDMKEYTFARQFDYADPAKMPKLNYIFIHCFPVLDAFVTNDPFADLVRYSIIHSQAVSRKLPVASTENY